jgi:hypothetical protein
MDYNVLEEIAASSFTTLELEEVGISEIFVHNCETTLY